ncbi:MAG: RsmD family RNA methyltransferase [Acidobacteria bacterium]|nr:RsmD family RNA methyltransferase [Acidobacteriota bacterium]
MNNLPIRFPAPSVFNSVRTRFHELGYTGAALDQALRQEPRLMSSYVHGEPVSGFDAAGTLTRLFFGGAANSAELACLVGEPLVEGLEELGLIEKEGDAIRPTVRLRPMLGLYVIADLHARYTDHSSDFVYPPDGPNTHEYLSHLPAQYEGTFLEACGGTGVAALVAASRGATESYSFDISERCSQFATFSALLSGITNFQARTGDTFAPAQTQQFDCIAMHPPYVPVFDSEFVFSDGGQDGEAITRKHIEALAGHTAPGGRVYCRCMLSDRTGQPVEARLRQWLGPQANEFDLVLHTMRTIDPVRFLWERPEGPATRTREEITRWVRMVEALKIQRFVLCAFVLQRHRAPREAFTLRREMSPETSPRHLQWLIDWQTQCAEGTAASIVLDSRLRVNKAALTIRYALTTGDWLSHSQSVSVAWPYAVTEQIGEAAQFLLPKLDGRTGRELLEELRQQGMIADIAPLAAYIAQLAASGFVLVEGHTP